MNSSPSRPAAVPVAAPVRVRERLAAAEDGPREVLHASRAAIYVDLDGWCLGLVSAGATAVPCALWSPLADLGALTGRPVAVSGGGLRIGEVQVRVARVVDARVTVVGARPHPPCRRAREVISAAGLGLCTDGPLTPADLDRLLGRGPGLTPLGDDVLAGWFATRVALGHPDLVLAAAVRRRLGVTTLLSATLLDCALRGEALPQLAAWLAEPTPATTDALLAVGATSGAGLLAGAELALASITTERVIDRPANRPANRPGRAA